MTIKEDNTTSSIPKLIEVASDAFKRYGDPVEAVTKAVCETIIEHFEAWIDRLISDYQSAPYLSKNHQDALYCRVQTLNWAKNNLKRIIEQELLK